MIIYEVNIKISPQIYNEYISWLEKHITLMMEHEGFIKYKKYTVDSDSPIKKELCIHYYIENMELFNHYLSKNSYAMRNDITLEKFQGKFSINRRVLLIE